MNKLHKLLVVASLTLTAGALSACGSSSASKAKLKSQLNWMTTSEIETMDPSKVVDTTGAEQLNNVMEGLYNLDANSKLTPGVAKSSKVSKDGLTWTFYLRKNARWSNGDQVTAADFVYAWQRTLDPKTASQQGNLYDGIKNADAVVAGKKKPSSLGVKAVGKYKLVVSLEHKLPYMRYLVASGLFPQNRKAVEKYGKKYGTASKYMVYNGAFKQTGWTGSNLSWKLVKNPYYWNKKSVKLQTVSYSVQKTQSTDLNLYQSGKLDAALLSSQAAKAMKTNKAYTVRRQGNTQYLTYNVSKYKFLQNVWVRRALSMAVNRQDLVKTVGGENTVAKTFSAPTVVASGQKFAAYVEKRNPNNVYMTYNKKLAAAYLAKGLKQLGMKKLSFTLTGDDDDTSKQTTEYLQSCFKAAFGDKVDVSVSNLPKTTRVSRMLNGQYQVTLTGLTSDFPDPYNFLKYMLTGQSYNFGKWSSKAFDQAVNKSQTATGAKRLSYLLQAEEVLTNQQALTPLYHMGRAWLVRPTVHGVVFNGGSYWFAHAYVYQK